MKVEISMSAARFALWNTYDAAIHDVIYSDGGNARYQLPLIHELQGVVRSVDGDTFDYAGQVEARLAEKDDQS